MLTEIELNIYRKYIYLMNATLGEFPFVFSIFLRSNFQLSSHRHYLLDSQQSQVTTPNSLSEWISNIKKCIKSSKKNAIPRSRHS